MVIAESRNELLIRKASLADKSALFTLYKSIAEKPGGIIRIPPEVNENYIETILTKSLQTGLILVSEVNGKLTGSIHAYEYGLSAFRHILTELTIVVAPDHQGTGVGKALFTAFLKNIHDHFKHILRVELFVREQNAKTITFYKKLGFKEEGRHYHKIKNSDGMHETPIEMTWFNPAYQPLNA
jgi:RimJ/RimL family protein N-acetyltransferase